MTRPRRSPWTIAALWSVPALLVAGVLGVVVVKRSADAYLRSDGFRSFLARKAGGTLRAEAAVAPLHFSGSNLYAESFTAQGTTTAKFSDLKIEGLRAELGWRKFLEQVWQIDRLDVQRVRVDLAGPRLERPAREESSRGASSGKRAAWLPNRVEIGAATIREAQLAWVGGALRGTALELRPADGGWSIEGAGGAIEHASLPPLTVQRLELNYREPALFVRSAEFRQGANGSVVADGEIDFGERLDLHAVLRNITLTPWLAGDWRARLHGEASGEITIRSALPVTGAPEIRGNLSLANGQLEALPVLNEIAAFTRTQQFRKLSLSRASCDFTQRGARLEARNLVLESERLIRIEGAFVVDGGRIDGTFQVGVTAASLQWLPGSQARVFTESRGGYLWAPMRLAGPVDKPSEDLSARLVAAAGNEVIDQAGGVLRDATKTMQEVTKGALDLLLGPAK